jgi:hypothetical protein
MDIAPQWPVIKDVVLFFIAVYGAALSTFNWRQAVKRDQRQVSIAASTVMPAFGNQLGNPYAKVEAINTGHRVVTIKTISLELPTGARLFSMAAGGIPGFPMIARKPQALELARRDAGGSLAWRSKCSHRHSLCRAE